MGQLKKCICGCGEKLVKRDGETPFQFRARRVVNKKHFAVYRKARGWFTGDISKMRRKKSDIEEVKVCGKCGKQKMELHKDGYGITDPFWFCTCKLKYDKQRRAYV